MSNDLIDNGSNFKDLMKDGIDIPKPIIITPAENYHSDYEYTRKKLKNLADIGEKALEHMEGIADETKDPKVYRVVGELLSANRDIIMSIIENAKHKSDIDGKSGGRLTDGNGKIVNNNTTVFVGTTKDIIKKVMEEEAKRTIEGTSIEVK